MQTAHAVAFYASEDELVSVVSLHLAQGLDHDEHVVVVGTDAHREGFATMLRRQGLDLTGSWGGRRYVELDAAETLSRIEVDGRIDGEAFRSTVAPLIEEGASRGRRVRVYGEMVALLWEQGDVTGALELERCWNELGETAEFSLLCGYPAGAMGDALLSDLGRACDLHGHVQPPRSYGNGHAETCAGDADGFETPQVAVFLPLRSAIPAARRFVQGVLESWGERTAAFDAAVVVTELATNAVVHAGSAFRTSVTRDDHTLRIAVEDACPGHPDVRTAEPTALSGRGLVLVDALADRSGFDIVAEGKIAWAEFASAR